MKRVITSVVFIAFLIYLIWWSRSPTPFVIVVFLAALLALREFYQMAEKLGAYPEATLGAIALFALLGSFAWESAEITLAVIAGFQIATMVAALARGRPFETALGSIAATTSGVLYVGLFLGYFIALRMIDRAGVRSSQLLSLLFLVVWAGDTGAYYVGRSMGRRKLAPKVSPGKTVEGAVGGLVVGFLGAVIGKLWFYRELGWGHVLALSVLLGTMGILGDLCESVLKRGAQLKDSGSMIPGHGGFLDRLDSLVFNAPLVYYYYRYLLA